MRRKLTILLFSLLTVVSFMISTEVFAFLCKYDALLGPKHLIVFYEPFHILYWFFTVNVSGSQYLISFIGLALLLIGSIILSVIFYSKFKLKATDTYGSSRWKTDKEMIEEGFANMNGGIILCQSNEAKFEKSFQKNKEGKTEVVWKQKKIGQLFGNAGPEHILMNSPTGAGKGVGFVIPTLLSWQESVIVYDIKKENWEKTSGWRGKFSTVLRFEPAVEYSVKFNPLMEISPGKESIADAQNLAEIIYSGDDHWLLNAIQLLTAVILYILYCEEDKSLGGCYSFLNNPERDISQTLDMMLKADIEDNDVKRTVNEIARNMKNKAEKELSSIVSTATSKLSLFQDPYVRNNTSKSDFCINDLMNNKYPVSLYIVVSPKDADRMKALTRIMLQMIGRKLTGENESFKHRLLYLIDEFPSLGVMPFFEEQIAYFRSYGIKLALVTQGFSQLYRLYTRHTTIIDNCKIKLIFGADTPDEQKIISEFLGKQTIIKKSKSESGKFSSFLMTGKSISETEMARPLMTPEEISQMDFDEVLIIRGGSFPFKGKKVMYFLDNRFTAKEGKGNRAFLPPPNDESIQTQYFKFLGDKPFDWYKKYSGKHVPDKNQENEKPISTELVLQTEDNVITNVDDYNFE